MRGLVTMVDPPHPITATPPPSKGVMANCFFVLCSFTPMQDSGSFDVSEPHGASMFCGVFLGFVFLCTAELLRMLPMSSPISAQPRQPFCFSRCTLVAYLQRVTRPAAIVQCLCRRWPSVPSPRWRRSRASMRPGRWSPGT